MKTSPRKEKACARVCRTPAPLWCDFFLLAPLYAPPLFLLIVFGSGKQHGPGKRAGGRHTNAAIRCISRLCQCGGGWTGGPVLRLLEPANATQGGDTWYAWNGIRSHHPERSECDGFGKSGNDQQSHGLELRDLGLSATATTAFSTLAFCAAQSLRKQPAFRKSACI